MILVAACLLGSGALGAMDLTPEQQAADSVNNQIQQEEKAKFDQVSLEAKNGKVDAIFELGCFYIYGQGVEQDEETGYSLVKQAADLGYAEAQALMGDYCGGREPDYDYTESLEWWRKAAAQGNGKAQYSIGQCYEAGLSVPQNDSLAVYWYRLAAEQGYDEAKSALSFCYKQGKGVDQDYQEALFWMLLVFPESWDQGYGSIEGIAYHLTDAERSSVEARAKQWLARHKR